MGAGCIFVARGPAVDEGEAGLLQRVLVGGRGGRSISLSIAVAAGYQPCPLASSYQLCLCFIQPAALFASLHLSALPANFQLPARLANLANL